MIAGRTPFTGGLLELLGRIQHDEVPPPSDWNAAVPPELERICLKCLARRSSDRYPTAEALAADLDDFRKGGRAGPGVRKPFRVVPKGLRPFDAADADFYVELLPGPRDARGCPRAWRSGRTAWRRPTRSGRSPSACSTDPVGAASRR